MVREISRELVEDFVRSGRFKLSWSGSIVRWVALEDELTGIRAVGRSYRGWSEAMNRAVADMQDQLGAGDMHRDSAIEP